MSSETLPRTTAGLVTAAIRAAGAGQASSLPGKIVDRLFPRYLTHHAAGLRDGLAIVTGTNGKTTTANMAAGVLGAAGWDIVHNAEGANLFSGIATAFTRSPAAPFALLEIDEAIVPLAISRLRAPRVLVMTNLFRDQLDRYGEVDRLADGWAKALAPLRGGDTALVANADDPLVAHVALQSGLPVTFFGVEGVTVDAAHEVSDVTLCPRCSSLLGYTARWLSQLGDYACGGCGFARPERDIAAAAIGVRDGRLEAELRGDLAQGTLRLGVPGVHNVYNALGALALAGGLGVESAVALPALADYRPVFGRWNVVRRGPTTVQVNLSKNPAGMNQTLRSLRELPGDKALVFVFNDRIADGRDVSWIWDVDMEELLPEATCVVATGSRRHEMALRLTYAGVDEARLETVDGVGAALGLLAQRRADSVYILPTYTALKEVRRVLAGWEVVDT